MFADVEYLSLEIMLTQTAFQKAVFSQREAFKIKCHRDEETENSSWKCNTHLDFHFCHGMCSCVNIK